MTSFQDGPVAGRHLMLKRSPVFLRVALFGKDEKDFDGLDQLVDVPRAHERLVAYQRVGDVSMMHINSRDKAGRRNGGFFSGATYSIVSPQPADDDMRTNERWQAWCLAEGAKRKAKS